ncbi:GNAT family N-acetyltransferase [Sunxiuqinia elliptica]|uniref:Acetyltransferase (GNAT) domain-containing protein n=1 Tax=Sunxiuqinia elliptica TaxID=655355 RepID=A0A1I2EQE6_9BACT|nr:GNAT family N-acetyltransferase [Sunxiuqinia elliptica]SFE95262.1 Acetyltransferase (GNAT) domain-containing protein [Sunxiuqinia elliptica]
MKDIVAPMPKEAILAELTAEKLLRKTNKGANEIYVITHHDSPNVMHEIGRLREITFREAGGGTGKEIDIDQYDTSENPYHQLIVWDPDAQEILGGYRYIMCANLPRDENGDVILATSRLFHFSEDFKKNYLPYTLELGRSFVQPAYQSSKAGAKALFALDNLWDGLGALIVDHPEMKYFFGKVTMYSHFHTDARNLIQYFFLKYFRDQENLVSPKKPMELNMDTEALAKIFDGGSYKEDYKILTQRVREYGENIPPLINAYMNLSPSMKTFGTVLNDRFGDVEETGIILTIKDIYEAKKDRHIETYVKGKEDDDFPTPI